MVSICGMVSISDRVWYQRYGTYGMVHMVWYGMVRYGMVSTCGMAVSVVWSVSVAQYNLNSNLGELTTCIHNLHLTQMN